MSEFLNGLQAASNAVAGNVSGPVDIIGWLLRKAGVPVPEDSLLSSQWMARQGLTAPVRQGASQVVGETAGLLGPIAAAAKAPQIARGLLGAGDNLAAQGTVNRGGAAAQRGVLGAEHFGVLDRTSKGVPDDVANAAFGLDGYVYHTPLRPFENAQETAIGVRANPISERLFSTDAPLSAKALAKIEAVPVSPRASRSFSDELANEGAMAFMHRDGRRFSVVMPSAKQDGKMQLTNYDARGAIGDSQHDTTGDAIQRLIDAGFSKVLDPSRAEALMQRVMLR